MKKENYLEFLEKTLDNYPVKNLKYLKKQVIDKNIAVEDQKQLNLGMDGIIDISNLELKEQIKKCLKRSQEAIKIFENWEFEKDYRYSVIFEINDFDYTWEQLDNKDYDENISQNQTIQQNNFNKYTTIKLHDRIFLKFSLALSGYHPQTGEEVLEKYVFIVIFHKEEKLVEFRFDTIGRNFEKDQINYPVLIEKMKTYLQNFLDINLIPLDLNFLISIGKNQEELKLVAQAMKLSNGGNAQLDVGNNQEYVLPLIGELKNLMVENKEELDKSPKLKEALEEFMYEKEEMSDYPWVELMWEDEIKTRNKRIKVFFNYKKLDYPLIQHYYNNVLIGMERMNYVIKYIAKNKKSS